MREERDVNHQLGEVKESVMSESSAHIDNFTFVCTDIRFKPGYRKADKKVGGKAGEHWKKRR